MHWRKTEVLSFSVPPEIKKEFKELAEEDRGERALPGESAGLRRLPEEKEFRRLQHHGALRSRDRFGSEEELFESLYQER